MNGALEEAEDGARAEKGAGRESQGHDERQGHSTGVSSLAPKQRPWPFSKDEVLVGGKQGGGGL